jgi:hypothetical protein
MHLHEAGERCFSYLPVPAFVCSRFESHRQAACAFGRSEMWRLCNTSGCIQEDEAVKQWQGIRRATANSVDPRRDCRERFMIEKGGNADRFQVFTLAALQVSRV